MNLPDGELVSHQREVIAEGLPSVEAPGRIIRYDREGTQLELFAGQRLLRGQPVRKAATSLLVGARHFIAETHGFMIGG